MEILKNFAVFEGLDGSGTSTQIDILEGFFKNRSPLPLLYKTFEPTNGSIGKLIRSALRKEINFNPKTIAMLFAADRYEHIYGPEGIEERCNRGELVVSDRYLPSSLVYQGITCGEEFPALVNRDFPRPELLLFFDIDPEIALKRISNRQHIEIYEYIEFQIMVRDRYKALLPGLSQKGVRVETIDATRSVEEVADEVWAAIGKMPIMNQ